MLIENPDAFKSWLTSILEPLCDADPAALAKYVYALVKKDKPVDELREVMMDQLDVFLQQETKPFVEMLFGSLEKQEYLKHSREPEKPTPPLPEPEKEPQLENHATNGPAPPLRHRVVVPRAAPPTEQTLVKVLPTELLEEPVYQPPRRRERRADSLRDKDDRRRRRSRSWERRNRPRRHLRENEHDGKRVRPSRSPSPRRYRNRSPPPADRASRSRSRSPVLTRDRDHDRERDRLRVVREIERDRISRDREHRDTISRSRDRDRSRDRSRERSRDRSRGSLSPIPDTRLDHKDGYKRRCRDFDEKGYCMRGDLCSWDHGADPLVLEDAALSRVMLPAHVPEYNPLAPDIWCGGAFPGYPPPHPPRELIPIPRVRHEAPPMAGMLPPRPRHPAPNKKPFDYNRLGPARPPLPANAANCSLEVKKVPRGLNDITHLNNHFCKFGKIVNIQVCYEGDPESALITFSTPTEANIAYKSTEAVLNNRFIKVFWHNPENKQENTAPAGQQQNKQTDRNSQFTSSHNKVLINRDNIKATQENKLQNEKNEKETANGQEPKKEQIKPFEKTKQVMEMYKRAQSLLETQLQQQVLLIKKLESGNMTPAQRTALLDAINSAQEGIEKLRKELVAYNGVIKQLQEESVARSMSRLQLAQQANSHKKPKTREEAQKEILDAELDMFTKQQEGQDVTDLAKKVAELRKQMSIQFPTHPTARRVHARGGRFNTPTRFTRGAMSGSRAFSVNQTVDHRPRALLISGFEADELDTLLQHFAQYGEVLSKHVDMSVPQLTLLYKVRAHAEQAAAHGRHCSDRTLSITWVTSVNKTLHNNIVHSNANSESRDGPARNGGPAPPVRVDHNDLNKDEFVHQQPAQEQPEESILRFDEEEEEEAEEDRSWRR
ncbi:RNA-binding protein 26 isoform X1 [Bombyx mori]|uniref:C3H1-type domain-containing protein n=1 Tax=Bombyx mori TaxID=7091 RepID=A0A8R2GBK4_BOMMO|nr:RNA-binding protein 26 isoform X1 [Bombyx mori]